METLKIRNIQLDLTHIERIETNAQITPEKLNRVEGALSEFIDKVKETQYELRKYKDVLNSLKTVEGAEAIKLVSESARKKYKQELKTLVLSLTDIYNKY